jgi:hypothetical protein
VLGVRLRRTQLAARCARAVLVLVLADLEPKPQYNILHHIECEYEGPWSLVLGACAWRLELEGEGRCVYCLATGAGP